jgi:bacteriorhodopsin
MKRGNQKLTPTRGLSIFFEPMNRKQTWLTVGCFLLLCGAIVFSIRGITFHDRGGFTAPHLNFAWLFVGNAVMAIVYLTLFLFFRRPKHQRLN